ncbi:hypothetical protein GT354_18395 [Streptomyces sp. SID3343]|nr:hypothetical protein [Streptomyces sp. SID3343]
MHRPRGTCGVCGRRVALTASHDVWRHDGPGHARLAGAPISCRGSWTPATETPDHAGPRQLDLLTLVDFAPAEPPEGYVDVAQDDRGEHDQAHETLALFADAGPAVGGSDS